MISKFWSNWAVMRANFIEATRHLRSEGMLVPDAKGVPRQSQWLHAQMKASRELVRLASELGFSPAARVRLGVRPPQQKPTPSQDPEVPPVEDYLEELRRAVLQ